MIPFQCLGCGKSLKTKEEMAGKHVKCPGCGQKVRVPELAAAPSPAPPGSPPGGAGSASEIGKSLPTAGAGSVHPPSGTGESATFPNDFREPTSASAGSRADGVAASPQGEASELTDFLAPPQAPDEIGRLGPYRVLRVLGAGGMGVVYQAEDPELQRLVALKAMLPALAASASARQRFLREARAAAAIKHDHIVAIYQVGQDRGAAFLAMEFLEGEPLDARLKRQPPLSLGEVLRIGRETALGLAAAHARGLVHRDIKPGNLWLERLVHGLPGDAAARTGGEPFRVKVLDFGLARSGEEQTQLTQQGAIVGTPAFMAPEQACGEKVDARCDLFSLGCVLYLLVTGTLPFKGADAISTLLAVATEIPRPPHEVAPGTPVELSDLVMRLLAKKPADRPASAQAVVEALAAIESDRTDLLAPSARPVKRPVQAKPAGRSRRLLVRAAVGLVLAVGVAAGIYALTRTVDQQPGPGAGVDPNKDDGHKKDDGEKKETPPLPTGLPLTPLTLVTRPAPLDGVESWTIDTRRHRGSAPVAVFSPDNQRVASAGDDATVRLWERSTGTLLRILIGHTAPVRVLAWSPDGTRLASAGDDYRVHIWDPDRGRLINTLPGHERRILALAWAPDGKVLASGGDDHTVRLWEMPSGQDLRTFKGHNGPVANIAWDRTGQKLLSVNGNRFLHWEKSAGKILDEVKDVKLWAWPDGNDTLVYVKHKGEDVQVWELATGKPRSLPVPVLQDEIGWCLGLSRDGKTLATRSKDSMTFWDAQNGKLLRTGKSQGYTGLTFSPDGKYLACQASYLHGIDLWSVDKGEKLRFLQGLWHSGGPRFSPDSKSVCGWMEHTATGKNTTVFWDVPDGKRWSIGLIRPDCEAAAWSPDGGRLAANKYLYQSSDGTVWDLNPLALSQVLPGVRFSPLPVAWSRDGKLLARSGGGLEIQLWDLPAQKPLRTLVGKRSSDLIVFSPQSDLLAAFSGEPWLWDAGTGQAVRRLDSLGKPVGVVVDAAWSPDGKTLATVNRDWNGVDLWDIDTGKHRKRLDRHKDRPRALAWSPDGKTLASGGADQTVHLWTHTGEFLTQLADSQKQSKVTALAWLPDGKTLAALSDNRALCLWDTSTDKLLRVHKDVETQGRFSADGKLLASLNTLAGIRLWDTATGQPRGVLVFIQPDSPNQFMIVTPDGHYLGSPPRIIDQEVVYVLKTAQGQDMLTPQEFAARFRKNDPEKVSQHLK
jgi:WD40 repeat protein/serine/threonine protein kinase